MVKRILVTGGAGFIGSAVCRQLSAAGHPVLNLDKLTYAASLDALPVDVRTVTADVCNRGAVFTAVASFEPDAIMHLAAESHVDRSISGPSVFIQTNVVGTETMLDAAYRYWDRMARDKRSGFRLLCVSTDEVYGSVDVGQASELSPIRPSSPYSASKAAAEHLALAWHTTYGLPVVVSRGSNTYGPWQHAEKLIPCMVRAAAEGNPMPVYGDGLNVRDWLHVEDHARALCLLIGNGVPGEVYNIGGSNEMTNIDLVARICRVMDDIRPSEAPHERLVAYVADRPGHDRRYAVDCRKIATAVGWRPSIGFEAGLERTIRWHMETL